MPSSRGDETRQRLLRAAADLVLEQGWGGVTTRVVADRAGVRSGVVHYHFGSIDELRREAVVSTFAEHFEPYVDLAATLPPLDLLEAMAEASVTDLRPGTDVTDLIYGALPATARDPRLQTVLADFLQRFREALASSIRTHHPDAVEPPEVVAEVIAALVDGLNLHLLAEPGLEIRHHLLALRHLLGPGATTTASDIDAPTEESSHVHPIAG